MYDIAAEKVEPFFDSLYSSLVSPTAGSATVPPLGALLVNPDKVRMNPTASGRAPYVYRYRYERGAATQQWVARQRYVLVDLAAGPCTYGPSDTGEGTVSLGSVPLVDVRPDDDQGGENVASVKFVSELASLLLSAVRHVFVGDAQWARSNSADKVSLDKTRRGMPAIALSLCRCSLDCASPHAPLTRFVVALRCSVVLLLLQLPLSGNRARGCVSQPPSLPPAASGRRRRFAAGWYTSTACRNSASLRTDNGILVAGPTPVLKRRALALSLTLFVLHTCLRRCCRSGE